MKQVFGIFETVFDAAYLLSALALGLMLLLLGTGNQARMLSGVMALVLVLGDGFHLLPRMAVIVTRREEEMRAALGRGKQITSITMTAFYLLLWQIGLLVFAPKGIGLWSAAVYLLAAVRVALCLLPQNRWQERYPPLRWGIWRNIPFFLQGAIVAGLFFAYAGMSPALGRMWIAIALSFAFYLPVVLLANQNPKVGMLMLPKTCAYVWMLALCFAL